MTGYAPASEGALHSDWGRFLHFSHRYLLPVGAGAAVAFAGAAVTGRLGPFVPYTPVVLGAVGAGSLATSVAYWLHHRSSRRGATAEVGPATPGATGSIGTPAAYVAPPFASPRCPVVEVARPNPRAPPVAAWRVGDELWSHWLVPQGAGLPSELIGPVPATAYARPVTGGFLPFPEKEPNFSISQGQLVPLSPTEGRTTPVVAEAPAEPSYDPVAAAVAALTPSIGLEGDSSPAGDVGPILEVSHAPSLTAPVLRPGPWPPALDAASPRPERPGLVRGARASHCATCGDLLAEPGISGHPCPECDAPVCSRCRRMAVIQYGQTWCSGCAAQFGWPVPGAAL